MRCAEVKRITNETEVQVALLLEGSGSYTIETPVPFLNHMLEQLAKHGLFDLRVWAKGDVEIDDHHTVEDIGITLGQALARALGDKRGVRRFGAAYVPLDEALSRVVVDLSGRPLLVFRAEFTASRIGGFDVQLVREFFQGFVNHAMLTLHVENFYGANAHHQVESIFKAFARALSEAVIVDDRIRGVSSTKGTLSG